MMYWIIGIIIIILIDIIWKALQGENWLNNAQKKQQTRFEYMNQALLEEPDENKVWDSEKGTWIDMAQVKRMERYKEYHKNRPPTYEEWKAAREAQKNNEGTVAK